MHLVYDITGIHPSVDYRSFLRAIRKLCKRTKVFKYLSVLTYNPTTNLKEAQISFGYKQSLDNILQNIFEKPLDVNGIVSNLKVTFNSSESYDDSKMQRKREPTESFDKFNTPNVKPFTRNWHGNNVRDRSRSPPSRTPSAADIGNPQQRNKRTPKSDPLVSFPRFVEAQKIIIDSGMNEIIDRVVPIHERRKPFYTLLNSQLRMKMAMALTDLQVYNYHTVKPEVVAEKYRMINPRQTDKEFVLQVYKMFKDAYWPVRQWENGKVWHRYPNVDDDVQAMLVQTADGSNQVQETAESSYSEAAHDDLLESVRPNDDKDKSNDVEAGDWTEDWN